MWIFTIDTEGISKTVKRFMNRLGTADTDSSATTGLLGMAMHLTLKTMGWIWNIGSY